MTGLTLQAAGGLRLALDDAAHWRIAWSEPDWLGPLGFVLHDRGHRVRAPAGAGGDPAAGACPPVEFLPFGGTDDLGTFHGFRLGGALASLPVRASVRAYADRPLLVFRLAAAAAIGGSDGPAVATGTFADPSAVWPCAWPGQRRAGGVPERTRAYGHQVAEFALPVNGDDRAEGCFLAPHRPPAVALLLLVAPDGRTLLLAPLTGFHEQIIALPGAPGPDAAGIRCGWHGDLAEIPAGFATEIGSGPPPRRVRP